MSTVVLVALEDVAARHFPCTGRYVSRLVVCRRQATVFRRILFINLTVSSSSIQFWFNLIFQLVFAIIQYTTSWRYFLLIAVVWGPACLLALAFHEWGHIGATRCQGGTYSFSMLWPLGGFNDCTVPNGKCMQEFFIALCGPFMHVPLMMVWVIVLAIAAPEGVSYYSKVKFSITRLNQDGASEWFAQLAKRSLDVNIMIFCLNLLLPAYPMDAANMVAAVCGHCGLSIETTGWVLLIVGVLLGIALLVVGIIYIISGGSPGIFLLLLGIYIMYTSWQMYGYINAGTLSQHPIFKPDCYSRENRRTTLSRSNSPRPGRVPPSGGQTPPSSPRKENSAKKSPRKASAPPGSPSKKPLPKRGNKAGGDVEMGNGGRGKKKAPTKK